MHGLQSTLHTVAQFGSGAIALIATGMGLRFFKDKEKLRIFGRFHATPLARICDGVVWTLKLGRRWKVPSAIEAALHLIATAALPVAGVVLTNVTAVDRHPVAFGLAGIIGGVVVEGPEAFARNAEYRSIKCSDAPVQHRFKWLNGLSSEQQVGRVALPVAVIEGVIGLALYVVVEFTTEVGAGLSAVVLGVAFVVWAEVMSVFSTLFLVFRRGSPFLERT
jgi:hypothetical protein